MTKVRRISPQEWISDYFSPLVTVLASPEAEAGVARKNNLTVCELLQPFAKLLADVTVKDVDGSPHAVQQLNVTFVDFKKDPSRLVNQKLMSDLLAREDAGEGDAGGGEGDKETGLFNGDASATASAGLLVTKTFPPPHDTTLEAPGFTPWFDTWMRLYLHSLPAAEHEFVRQHVGCVFVVSSSSRERPMEQLAALAEQQRQQQQDKPHAYPQYLAGPAGGAAALKYYVLLHDAYEETEARAHELFTAMQAAFGSQLCHLLQVNSAAEAQQPGALGDHWLGHGHRFCNAEARREGVGATIITTAHTMQLQQQQQSAKKPAEAAPTPAPSTISHPLAAVTNSDSAASSAAAPGQDGGSAPSSPTAPAPPAQVLRPVTPDNIATHLTSNDVDRIRIFVREFCIKGLVPHMERLMRQLNEVVTNRKSRSLFSGAKRWFGSQAKTGAAVVGGVGSGGVGSGGMGSGNGTSVVYGKEAPELQLRKLADVYFMLKIYKGAYSCYHTAKKDFQIDEAWNYYAGAAEMCALAQFMQSTSPADGGGSGGSNKKYPAHYIEDSITKYSQVCQLPEFAVRATLFDALCLKYLGMFQEAAVSYIRLTSETKELRSSLLLEQAAYCFLLSTKPGPLIRKYAFHIVLAGYRFSKAGQKRHASRAYRQGLQVYQGLDWGLSEDHILYTLGHQRLLLKDHAGAAALFNKLLDCDATPNQVSALQQMCHLREFFIVHHLREKEDKTAALVTIPKFRAQQCVLDLTSAGDAAGGGGAGGVKGHAYLSSLNKKDSWQCLEKAMAERIQRREMMFLSKSCQSVFNAGSRNNTVPQAAVGERVRLVLPVQNVFQTPLVLKKLHLLWTFLPADESSSSSTTPSEPLSNDGKSKASSAADKYVHTDVLDEVAVDKGSTAHVSLWLRAHRPGELTITGVQYRLKAQFPQTESTDYTIRGRQELSVRGPRLNANKEQRAGVVYDRDCRLQVEVRDRQPRLAMRLDAWPETAFQDEVRQVQLTLTNAGDVPVAGVHLVHHQTGMFSFGGNAVQKSPGCLFAMPAVQDEPALAAVQENGQVVQRQLDFLPVPLRKEAGGGGGGGLHQLDPGQSLTLALWVHVPSRLGMNQVRLYCYYERSELASPSHNAKPTYRILSSEHTLRVLPSVAMTAAASHACLFDAKGRPGRTLLLHASNVSREKGRLDAVAVRQVSLVSRHGCQLSRLQSRSDACCLVARGESTTVGFKASCQERASADGTVDDVIDDQSELLVSSVVLGGRKDEVKYGVQLPPYLDFVKQGFQFRLPEHLEKQQHRPSSSSSLAERRPYLHSDLIVVFWQGRDAAAKGTSSMVEGQMVLPLKSPPKAEAADQADGPGQAASDKAPVTARPCQVEVGVPERTRHDFRRRRICLVPCSLRVRNTSRGAARLRLRVSDGADDAAGDADDRGQYSFLGCTSVDDVEVEAGGEREYRFKVAVTSPGLFQCAGLGFQMLKGRPPPTADDDKEDNDVDLVPLKLAFVVVQADDEDAKVSAA